MSNCTVINERPSVNSVVGYDSSMMFNQSIPLNIGCIVEEGTSYDITKGDMVSQAEREIFRERILEMNPDCRIIETNGLTGKGSVELSACFNESAEYNYSEESLRHNAPFSICTLCVGEIRVHKKYHRGIIRHFNGIQEYLGE